MSESDKLLWKRLYSPLCIWFTTKNRIFVQERHGIGSDGLAFLVGHVEIGGSFTKSVVREVYEEAGYQIKNPV